MARAKPKIAPAAPVIPDLPPFNDSDKAEVRKIVGKKASNEFLAKFENEIRSYRFWYRFWKQQPTLAESKAALRKIKVHCQGIQSLIGTGANETGGALKLIIDSVKYQNYLDVNGRSVSTDPKDRAKLHKEVRETLESARDSVEMIRSYCERALANMPKPKRGARKSSTKIALAARLAFLLDDIGIKPTLTNFENDVLSKYLQFVEDHPKLTHFRW